MEEAACVHPGDAASARANGMDIDHGKPDGISDKLSFLGNKGSAAFDKADFGARPPNIEGDDVRDSRLSGYMHRPHDACGGTRG
jgi:hypothetical protein